MSLSQIAAIIADSAGVSLQTARLYWQTVGEVNPPDGALIVLAGSMGVCVGVVSGDIVVNPKLPDGYASLSTYERLIILPSDNG